MKDSIALLYICCDFNICSCLLSSQVYPFACPLFYHDIDRYVALTLLYFFPILSSRNWLNLESPANFLRNMAIALDKERDLTQQAALMSQQKPKDYKMK